MQVQNKTEESVSKNNLVENQELSYDVPDEIIAVISAAVASLYICSDKKFVIKSMKKSRPKPPWAMAGIFDNTNPFFK